MKHKAEVKQTLSQHTCRGDVLDEGTFESARVMSRDAVGLN